MVVREPGVQAVEAPKNRTRRWVPGRVLIVAAVVLALALVPLFVAPYETGVLSSILVFALLAASLDLLVGVTGLPSLGHAAYFGAGAYAAGWVSLNLTAAAPVPLLVAVVTAGVVAAATGWVAVRSRGTFFLMLTLAIGELLFQLAQSWQSVTGGSNGLYGIPSVRVGRSPLVQAGFVYWYVLVGALIGFGLLWTISRSPFAAALRGIRDNEARMRSLGYSPFRYKYVAYVLAGALAGLAGGLLAAQERLVTPADLGFTTSALALLAVVLGGAGTLWGAVVGAALVVLIRDALGPSLAGHGQLVLGLVFVLAVYLLPRGFAGARLPRRRAP